MASIVSAGTTSGTALNMSGDTSGVLQLASNNGTTAVTIDTSQNVGIGTTSPAVKLEVAGQGKYNALTFAYNTGYYNQDNQISNYASTNYLYVSGNGTSSGGLYLQGGGNQKQNIILDGISTGGNIAFTTNGSERMRVDSSGNLLVGTTSTITVAGLGSTNTFKSSTSGSSVLTLQNTNATDAKGLVINYTTDFNSAGQQVIFFYSGSTTRFVVNSNGNVANTNNSYGAISDQKLKENIVDATPKLDNLCKVKVRNFNLIGETTKQIGVVAQELEQVFPSMIEESPDKDGEGNELGTTSKSVKYSVFVPMLVKAIQELKAINDTQAETLTQQTEAINALTARIVALESRGTV